MDFELENRFALVTAASEGLGYACAKTLVDEKCRVVISSRDIQKLNRACEETGAISGVSCDLGSLEALNHLASEIEKICDAPDILVISTAHPPTKPFSRATEEDWDIGHNLLIRPVITLCRRWLPIMMQKGYGRIIVIGSIFGREHEESSVIQSTYRAGLHGLVKCIAREYAASGITANVVCPGYFDTPLVRNLAHQYAQERKLDDNIILDEWKNFSPSRRYGRFDEIGALVAYLASPSGGFTNGSAITIDGAATRST